MINSATCECSFKIETIYIFICPEFFNVVLCINHCSTCPQMYKKLDPLLFPHLPTLIVVPVETIGTIQFNKHNDIYKHK